MTRQIEPRRRDPALRREIIIEAATEAIGANGLDGVTFISLARQTGMALQTLYNLFESKQDLLLEICDHHLCALVAAAETADLPAVSNRRRLDTLAVALAKVIGARAAAHRIFAISLTNLPPKALKDLVHRQNWLATLFAEALTACLPDVTRHPKLANAAVTSLLTLLLADRPEPLARAAYARFCVTCTLEGLRSALQSKKAEASF